MAMTILASVSLIGALGMYASFADLYLLTVAGGKLTGISTSSPSLGARRCIPGVQGYFRVIANSRKEMFDAFFVGELKFVPLYKQGMCRCIGLLEILTLVRSEIVCQQFYQFLELSNRN